MKFIPIIFMGALLVGCGTAGRIDAGLESAWAAADEIVKKGKKVEASTIKGMATAFDAYCERAPEVVKTYVRGKTVGALVEMKSKWRPNPGGFCVKAE